MLVIFEILLQLHLTSESKSVGVCWGFVDWGRCCMQMLQIGVSLRNLSEPSLDEDPSGLYGKEHAARDAYLKESYLKDGFILRLGAGLLVNTALSLENLRLVFSCN
ncbi:unnamed protein product [Calypogeia fissa]